MQAPELGTRPRPDTTGPAKYRTPDFPHDQNGIHPQPIFPAMAFWVPWGALELIWDFNETKYPVTEYQIEMSLEANFEMHLPEAERGKTGLVGTNPPGDFSQVAVSINTYTGLSTAIQPTIQYYMRVRALLADGSLTEWSEAAGCAADPLPAANGIVGDGTVDEAPIAGFTATPTGDTVAVASTATPNAVTASPIFDLRYHAEGPVTQPLPVRAEDGNFIFGESGTYTITQYVTDEAGKTSVTSQQVMVVVP